MNPERHDRIGVQLHGVALNLRCNYGEQLQYVVSFLGDCVREPWERPDLEVEGNWLTPSREEDIDRPVFDVTGLDAYGKRMHLSADQLVWSNTHRDKNLQLRFRRAACPVFDVAYLYRPSPKKLARFPDYERKKFFDLMQYLVLFPLAWHLRRTRGWELIHASAVAAGERGVVIAGPGGAGKTTTCIALVTKAGMRLVTENLVFCDGDHIYPVCEPIRLTGESLDLLGDAADRLQPFNGGLKHKAMFLPPVEANPPGIRPALVFLPRFSSAGYVRAIPPPEACDIILATNLLTLELNDFYWYAAALDLLWPGENHAAEKRVHRLTRTTPCFSLGIDRSAGVGPVVDRILECLQGQPLLVSELDTP